MHIVSIDHNRIPEIARTPVPNSQSLFPAGIEHRADNHEARSDRSFTHSKNKADNEEACEILASGMGAERNGPYEDVEAGSM
jgi:hypothetical protein